MEFKAKDWVLVRDDETQKWKLDIFSHFVDGASFPYICIGDYYDECLPYEGNEALLGTSDAPAEWNVGDEVEVLCDHDDKWYPGKIIDIDSSRIMRFKVESSAFKEWRGCPLWCAADQLRKPEEKSAGEGWNVGDKVEVYEVWSEKWYDGKIVGINAAKMKDDGLGFKVESECFDRAGGWKWCKADQLRKPGAEETPWRPKAGEAVEALVDNKWQDAVLITDDHDDCMPYCIRFDNGTTMWCKTSQIRKPAEKKEPDEPYKFGDRVEANIDGDWCEAVVIDTDHSDLPVRVATVNGAVHWRSRKDVRHA